MRNHEVTKVQPLLNADGTLREPGWSRKLCQVYDRNAIKAPKFRIKEWDYYLIISEKNNFGVALTLSDDGYIGLQSATLLDFSIPWEHTESFLTERLAAEGIAHEIDENVCKNADWENNWKKYFKPMPIGERLGSV